MNQNSFQKNGFLNMNTNTSSFVQDPNKLGRRTISDIKDDMFKAKTRKVDVNLDKPESQVNVNGNQDNMRQRIDYLKKVDNINRWK